MFVRGGYVYSDNYLNRAGFDGNHWSSIGFYDAIAYALYFSLSNIVPAYNHTRYLGFPVRCVALGG